MKLIAMLGAACGMEPPSPTILEVAQGTWLDGDMTLRCEKVPDKDEAWQTCEKSKGCLQSNMGQVWLSYILIRFDAYITAIMINYYYIYIYMYRSSFCLVWSNPST